MKSYQLLAGILLLLFFASTVSTLAYTPKKDGFVEVLIMADPQDQNNVVVNSVVDFYVMIKNLTNDTISGINVTQKVPENTKIVAIADQQLSGPQAFVNKTVPDSVTNKQLTFTYLNTSSSNFNGSIDISLKSQDFFLINFKVNLTEVGTYTFERPSISYFDHWGDVNTDNRGLSTTVRTVAADVDTRTKFFPEVSVTDPNYGIIVGLLLLVFLVAILGRALHFKRPFRL